VKDSLAVYLEKENGEGTISLFVVLTKEKTLTEDLKTQIKDALRTQYSPRHVPDTIEQVNDIPYTINGKKMEAPMKRILMGQDPAKVYQYRYHAKSRVVEGFCLTLIFICIKQPKLLTSR
jgi:acetoacetyl-CoA synthetase